MKKLVIAATIGLAAAMMASPTLAQTAPAAAAPKAAAPAAGKLSAEKSKISEIRANPKAKAAVEKALPQLAEYYDQIGEMSLGEIMPMSQGTITPEIIKSLQAEFDKL